MRVGKGNKSLWRKKIGIMGSRLRCSFDIVYKVFPVRARARVVFVGKVKF